jgi:Protein of unknown function (DUF3263)
MIVSPRQYAAGDMLTDTQKAMLDVAAQTYKYAGSVDVIAKERFGLTPTRFWQEINALIQTEAAVAYRPEAVRRLNQRRRPQVRLQQRILS